MIFALDEERDRLRHLPKQGHASLDILERRDLQEWAIDESRLLGEELLIITSEFGGFEEILDRLDILALDRKGQLVVVELKRDKADRTTDLQAIKYASYCATLTGVDIQKEYQEFWSDRRGETLTSETVGQEFQGFLEEESEGEIPVTEEGWAEVELGDKPRILLAAGSFGTEVTSPVLWLYQEFGMDITCVRFEVHEIDGNVLVNSQQVIPVKEAEEYMTKRREKREKQSSTQDYVWTLDYLVENDYLEEGETLVFNEGRVPDGGEPEFDPEADFWRAEFTGETGQQNSFRWLQDNEVYSITALTKELLHQYNGRDKEKNLHGYSYWCHPSHGNEDLYTIKKADGPADEA